MPSTALQGMFDASAPVGMQNHWRSAYLADLPDAAVDTLLAHAERIPAPMGQVHLHQLGGAMGRVPAGAGAFGHRDAAYLMNIIGTWPDPAESEAHVAWVRGLSEAIAPHSTGGA
jgi:hypothetical protein